MKTTRLLGAALLATSVFLGGCDDDDEDPNGPTNTATVQFVNLTGQSIDIGQNGNFSGRTNLSFGSGTCVNVNTANPALTFRQNGQATTWTPTGINFGSLQAGQNYTVVLRNGSTAGTYTGTQFTDTYSGASSTMGGVRVINATTGATNYGLYVGAAGTTRPSTATDATFGAGDFTANFIPLSTGNGQVWFTTGAGAAMTNAFTTGSFPVTANGYQTIIVTDPATSGGDLRFTRLNRCS